MREDLVTKFCDEINKSGKYQIVDMCGVKCVWYKDIEVPPVGELFDSRFFNLMYEVIKQFGKDFGDIFIPRLQYEHFRKMLPVICCEMNVHLLHSLRQDGVDTETRDTLGLQLRADTVFSYFMKDRELLVTISHVFPEKSMYIYADENEHEERYNMFLGRFKGIADALHAIGRLDDKEYGCIESYID